MNEHTLADFIGNTPLARLTRLPGIGNNRLYAKLEGNNPAGSVKDRPAYSMIRRAEEVGDQHIHWWTGWSTEWRAQLAKGAR